MPFDVAFVCTGNRFRSALAEVAFRAAAEGLPVRVGSYGTLDLGPAGPMPEAVEAARAVGLDLSEHSARCVAGANLSDTALVLGFELVHAAAAVASADARPERTFTLLELLALLEHVEPADEPDPVDRAREAIDRAQALRGSGQRPVPAEIEDPIGRPPSSQQEIGRQVYEAATRLAGLLFGEPARATGAGG